MTFVLLALALSWQVPFSYPASYYNQAWIIYRGDAGGPLVHLVTLTNGFTRYYEDTTTQGGVQYCYQLQGANQNGGSAMSNIACNTGTAPAKPASAGQAVLVLAAIKPLVTDLHGVPDSAAKTVSLTWTNPTDPHATCWQLERRLSTQVNYTVISECRILGQPWINQNVAPGSYDYRLTVKAGATILGYSNVERVTL